MRKDRTLAPDHAEGKRGGAPARLRPTPTPDRPVAQGRGLPCPGRYRVVVSPDGECSRRPVHQFAASTSSKVASPAASTAKFG